MGRLLFFLIMLGVLSADYYMVTPNNNIIAGGLNLHVSYFNDPAKSLTANYTAVFLEAENHSPYLVRLEPNFNSFLIDQNRKKHYKIRLAASDKYEDGILKNGEKRRGFLYFNKIQGEIPGRFQLVLENIKVYDKKSRLKKVSWELYPVSGNIYATPEELRQQEESLPPTESKTESPGLDYEKQKLIAKNEGVNLDEANFVIEIKRYVHRGETIPLEVFVPTLVDVESITAVVGIANYVNLKKDVDGVFKGYFAVPVVFDPGKYIVSFYIRTTDQKNSVRQKIIEIIKN